MVSNNYNVIKLIGVCKMKIRFLLTLILISFINVSAFAGFKGIAGEKLTEKLNKDKIRLLQNVKFTEEDLKTVYDISWFGDSNTAYDICSRIRKLSVDEIFLEKVKFYQNITLIRILVENGSITSINQLPSKSMGFFDQNSTVETRDFYSEDNHEMVPYEADARSEEIARRYIEFMDKICTYSLVEKYPSAAEKLFWDYTSKHRFDRFFAEDIILFLTDKNEIKRAYYFVANIFDKYPNEYGVLEMVVSICIKAEEIDFALKIINDLIDNTPSIDEESNFKLRNLLVLKAYIYEASDADENREEIQKLTNWYSELLSQSELKHNKINAEKINSGEMKINNFSNLAGRKTASNIGTLLPFIRGYFRIYEYEEYAKEFNEEQMSTFRKEEGE